MGINGNRGIENLVLPVVYSQLGAALQQLNGICQILIRQDKDGD
jgi:hypothetical protein